MITRGIKEASEKFIKELSSKYVTLPMTNKKNGKIKDVATVIHIRPIQLWEVVFPKEHRDTLLTTLFPDNKGKSNNKGAERIFEWIRRFLPMKPIPKEWDMSKKYMVDGEGVDRIALGIKEDAIGDYKKSSEVLEKLKLDPKGDYECEAL